VAIDPAAVNDPGASNDLKDFEIKVSTTDRSPGSFSTVFSGSAKPGPTLQRFEFAHPVAARYVELLAVNNEGGISAIEVAELEVVGDPNPLPEQPATPTPKPVLRAELPNTATPTPTDTPTPTPTATLVHVARPKPTVSYPSLPTATSTPVRVITVKKTPTATPTPTPPSSGCNDQDQDPASYHHSANFGPKPHPDPCHAK
jgi:hypothetical protein